MDYTRIKYVVLVGLVILAVFAAFLFMRQPKAPTSNLDNERSWNAQAFPVQYNSYAPEVILYGTVDSPQKSTLSSALNAKVIKVHVREGQEVKKGQILVALEDDEFALIVTQREAQLKKLQASLEAEYNRLKQDKRTQEHLKDLVETNQKIMKRFKRLQKGRHASESQVDETLKAILQQQINLREQELAIANHPLRTRQLQADLEANTALIAQAKLDLEDTRILAPFDGRITKVMVSVGDDVAVNQKLITLYNLHDVELRAQLPTKTLHRFHLTHPKEPLYARPIQQPDIALPLQRIGAELNDGKASVDIFFKVPFALAKRYPLGYTVSLRLSLEPMSGLIKIPSSALYSNNRVYKIANQRLQSITVERIGDQYDTNHHFYLIRSPKLKDGDQLLKTKMPNAREGLKVDIL